MWKNSTCSASVRGHLIRPLSGYTRRVGQGFALCLLVMLVGGCGKSKSNDQVGGQPPPSSSAADPQSSHITRIHWLGKKQISAETNAAGLMQIWNLPESARLENQTLDKLALALAGQLPITNPPASTTTTNTPAVITNYHSFLTGASALLRPLLEDTLQQECYFELHQPTNQPWALALAVRVGDVGAALWETNLAAALQLLGGSRPVAAANGHGWQMQINDLHTLFQGILPPSSARSPQSSALIELSRSGEWTLLGLASGPHSVLRNPNSALSTHPFLAEFRSRLDSLGRGASLNATTTNFWLDAELDLADLAPIVWREASLLQNLPRIALTVVGDGQNVRTRGTLDFPKPLLYREEPWNIPTNLISQPLASFTAIRGIAPWLASLKEWNDLQVGPPPNQLFLWAMEYPMQTFFAAPQPEASNQVARLTDQILQQGATFFATNDVATFERSQTSQGLEWKGLPVISPFLRSTHETGGDFLLAGFMPPTATNRPPPIELIWQITERADLVWYDWELTGPRIQQWLAIGQFFRFAMYRQQMVSESASLSWLKAAVPKLGNGGTTVSLTAPNQLSFVRRSSVGFSAFELHLLADWLESPDFPRGIHSFIPVPPAE